VLKTHNL